MRTKEDIQREIDRWVGKRNQHILHQQGHPMLALDCQNKIDDLLEELEALDREPCPKCLGSGKLQDPVHDWVIITCFICKGSGKKPANFDKLYGDKQ